MVNVAIHTLGAELSASVSTVRWVSTAYLLALTIAIPLTGWSIFANTFWSAIGFTLIGVVPARPGP